MELVLAFPKGLLGAIALLNIQIHSDPPQYGAIARPERFGATEEPAVDAYQVCAGMTFRVANGAKNPDCSSAFLLSPMSIVIFYLGFYASTERYRGRYG
jgi:hypothetical protein